jgi:hypothetical protein
MTKADIAAGICGFTTVVKARMEGSACILSIESECDAIQQLASKLTQVDPFREFTFRGAGPLTYQTAAENCKHAACPVPTGIIKTVEVEAGLALPADVTIKISRSDE